MSRAEGHRSGERGAEERPGTGLRLDPFYLIVDDAEMAERLVPVGVKLLQLRAKDMDAARLRREVRCTRDVCAAHG